MHIFVSRIKSTTMADDRLDIIRRYVTTHPQCSSTEIFEGIGQTVAYATVRRDLAKLLADGVLLVTGKGKASRCPQPMHCFNLSIWMAILVRKLMSGKSTKPITSI